ncbi:unnamed protein product [Caenorhabditis angaria]|uniref:DUF38 domain-containing protein n=1 Tax=Caenorhabditis angaria TaxID=860376 RepID=A0A9P1IGM7_9PELO|nr:unnamed protein product [Caenorhabditis angaria]
MKFLILHVLLAIFAFSKCQPPNATEETRNFVKTFEAKISALLAAKNFDGLSKYIAEKLTFGVNGVSGYTRQEFIDYLKNGTFVMFNGFDPKDLLDDIHIQSDEMFVSRSWITGKTERRLYYALEEHDGTEFGRLFSRYFEWSQKAPDFF